MTRGIASAIPRPSPRHVRSRSQSTIDPPECARRSPADMDKQVKVEPKTKEEEEKQKRENDFKAQCGALRIAPHLRLPGSSRTSPPLSEPPPSARSSISSPSRISASSSMTYAAVSAPHRTGTSRRQRRWLIRALGERILPRSSVSRLPSGADATSWYRDDQALRGRRGPHLRSRHQGYATRPHSFPTAHAGAPPALH